MAGGVLAMAIAVFLAGVLAGVLVAVTVVLRREDRRYAVTGQVPAWLDTGVRRLGGVGHRVAGRELMARDDRRP